MTNGKKLTARQLERVRGFRETPNYCVCDWCRRTTVWQPVRPVVAQPNDVHNPNTSHHPESREQGEVG